MIETLDFDEKAKSLLDTPDWIIRISAIKYCAEQSRFDLLKSHFANETDEECLFALTHLYLNFSPDSVHEKFELIKQYLPSSFASGFDYGYNSSFINIMLKWLGENGTIETDKYVDSKFICDLSDQAYLMLLYYLHRTDYSNKQIYDKFGRHKHVFSYSDSRKIFELFTLTRRLDLVDSSMLLGLLCGRIISY